MAIKISRVVPVLSTALLLLAQPIIAQQKKAYLIDGYHGGFWGHYPTNYTSFIVEQLKAHPDWKINLEIEPETWDMAKAKDEKGYNDFKALFADQNIATRRIEYVSPAYGQAYMYNISGESVIRQLSYGMEAVRKHFPTAVFTTYSSEEPCFTSALPQILKSFGYKYASLKNPNTLWGGYARAHGGELVNWIGPDGTALVTVPRYGIEALKPKSTWETIGHTNSKVFINAALDAGIKNPVAMTLQDAGWKGGPLMGDGKGGYQPTEYRTWTDYVDNSSIKTPTENWKFSQEDVQTSLVWGSQILQRIAQQVRGAENNLIIAEKLAAMAKVYKNAPWPKASLYEGWTRLLLSQHHDCWIVPYNTGQGNTWADKVVTWTNITEKNTDSIRAASVSVINKGTKKSNESYVRIFNTLGINRTEFVRTTIPPGLDSNVAVFDSKGNQVLSHITNKRFLDFKANVPAMGYTTYRLQKQPRKTQSGAKLYKLPDGNYRVETDLYIVLIDQQKGGTIKSLIAKKLNNKEFVDQANPRRFNELRGNFFKDGGFKSTAEAPVEITVLENGPGGIKFEMWGKIADHVFVERLTFTQGQPIIDIEMNISWQGKPGIGNDYQQTKYDALSLRKAFYDDRDKLLALFPLNLKGQKVYKNAPFDVTESKLQNTFFNSWDSIKNNVVLNWVDVTDSQNKYGMALLTDHTTNYAHGSDFPLGLDIAYSGVGLWGRNYSLSSSTHINYALIPHAGKWDNAGIWTESTKFNEPLTVVRMDTEPERWSRSLVNVVGSGLEISSVTASGDDLLVRLFNAEGDNQLKKITLDAVAAKAELVALNGDLVQNLTATKTIGTTSVNVAMPRFGIRTVRFVGVKGK